MPAKHWVWVEKREQWVFPEDKQKEEAAPAGPWSSSEPVRKEQKGTLGTVVLPGRAPLCPGSA